ncbi:hypothetical protein [Pseudomonas sp. 31-12]|uniref:hypothetical protein n=1 Tax=Pseudomonas sp. 31-12 TaxID=2201356 RepID=UPI0026927CBF
MPGAIETIAIVTFSGGLNVVFILTHHMVRMIVLHLAPALIVQARRWRALAGRVIAEHKPATPPTVEAFCFVLTGGRD